MDNGWVCLHRNIQDWEWYQDANTMRLFIHCLVRANHTDNTWRGHEVKRGQFITSLDTLSRELNLSVKQIRTAISKLKKTGEVASQSNSQHTVLTIKNYDQYQDKGKPKGTQRASKGQAEGKQGATNNNDNNETMKQTTLEAEEDLKLATWIHSQIILTAPHTKQPNFDKWANTIRLMRTQDSLNHRLIAEVFRWANGDSFWKSNILSPSKLRDKFATLHAKKESENEINQRPDQRTSAVDRVKNNIERRQRERAERNTCGDSVGETISDVRIQVLEPVRGGTGQDMGNVLEGDYRTTDG